MNHLFPLFVFACYFFFVPLNICTNENVHIIVLTHTKFCLCFCSECTTIALSWIFNIAYQNHQNTAQTKKQNQQTKKIANQILRSGLMRISKQSIVWLDISFVYINISFVKIYSEIEIVYVRFDLVPHTISGEC